MPPRRCSAADAADLVQAPAFMYMLGAIDALLHFKMMHLRLMRVIASMKPSGCSLQRKKTLLVEYKELQKSNAFIDRRFGGGCYLS